MPGVYIKLADNLVPQSPVRESERKQSELLEAWTRTNKVARGKIFRLGSEEMVSFGKDNGLQQPLGAEDQTRGLVDVNHSDHRHQDA